MIAMIGVVLGSALALALVGTLVFFWGALPGRADGYSEENCTVYKVDGVQHITNVKYRRAK